MLDVRVRRALLRVPACFTRNAGAQIRDRRFYQNRRNSALFEEITKVTIGGRGNHRLSAIYRSVNSRSYLYGLSGTIFVLATQHRSFM